MPAPVLVLAVLAESLEVLGYVVRVAGVPHAVARPLSMELPFSIPRLFVAAVFLSAAALAGLGAGRLPGRRTWWTAIAAISAAIAAVKAGSEVHKILLERLGVYDRPALALAVSAPLALAVIGWLGWLSRHERRDRRRMLMCLGAYAVAAVGLSSVSAAVEDALGHGSVWTATAAFIEESGEALSSVAFLFGVLLGVAPRVSLPAWWSLRRTDDAFGLEGAEPLPARRVIAPGQATR